METKDYPLILREKVVEYETQDDGSLKPVKTEMHLAMEAWPPRHEFTSEWLLRIVSNGEGKVTHDTIELTFANAHAVYSIVDDAHHGSLIGDPEYQSASGSLWGYLKEGTVD